MSTNSVGEFDASDRRIINVIDPNDEYDAANKGYIDLQIYELMQKSLDVLTEEGHPVYGAKMRRITLVAAPTNNYNAANKKYVDNNISKYKNRLGELINTNKTKIE